MLFEDRGRTDKHGQKEFIIEVTGGPKKYYNKRRRKNPLFTEPKVVAIPIVTVDWYRNLVQSLRLERLTKKLTQAQLGKLTGSNQAAVSKFEQGLTNPSLKFLVNYTTALDIRLVIKFDNHSK